MCVADVVFVVATVTKYFECFEERKTNSTSSAKRTFIQYLRWVRERIHDRIKSGGKLLMRSKKNQFNCGSSYKLAKISNK